MTSTNEALDVFQKTLVELMVQKAQLEMRAAQEAWKEAEAKRKEAEECLAQCRYNRELDKNRRRPSRELWVEIRHEPENNRWVAERQGVVAYGDSPEMACDNFDHLWLYGEQRWSVKSSLMSMMFSVQWHRTCCVCLDVLLTVKTIVAGLVILILILRSWPVEYWVEKSVGRNFGTASPKQHGQPFQRHPSPIGSLKSAPRLSGSVTCTWRLRQLTRRGVLQAR
jgi:hypothetical protein